MHDADGTHVKALTRSTQWVPVDARRASRVVRRGRGQPDVLTGFRPTHLGDRLTAGDRPLYRLARPSCRRLEREVWGSLADLEVARRAHARALAGRAARLGTAPGDRAVPGRPRPDGRAGDRRRGARGAGGRARRPGARRRAPDLRRRPRAHRLGLAVADARDGAQGGPHGRQRRQLARRRRPGLVYAMSQRPAVRLARGAPPRVVRARPGARARRAGSCRSAGCGSSPTPTCPAARRWPGSSCTASGSSSSDFGVDTAGGVAARLVRLHRRAAADRPAGRVAVVPHPEDLLEHRPTASRTTPSGGRASTGPGSSPTSRRSTPTTAELSGARARARRRQLRARRARRPASLVPFGYGDGGGGPTREMLRPGPPDRDLAGSPRVTVETPHAFFAAAEEEYADAPVWSGELYLEIHRGTYTSQAATKQGNRRSEHLLREAELWSATAAVRRTARLPRTTTWTGSGRRCCCTSSTTSCPGSSIAWVHREARGDVRAGRRRAGGDRSARRRSHGAGRRDGDRARGRLQRRAGTPVERRPGSGAAADVAAGRGPATPSRRRPTACPGQRPAARRRRRQGGVIPRCTTRAPAARCSPPGAAGNLLQLHPDHPEPLGRLGPRRALPHTRADLTDADVGRVVPSSGAAAVVVHAAPFGEVLSAVHAGIRLRRATGGSRSTPRSTGTSARSSSRRPSRSTCTPTTRRPRSSSGTSSGRPTRTPPGTRRGSRSARTGGCTSASRGTASRWSTTRRTATTSPGTARAGGGTTTTCAAQPAARAAVPRPGDRPGPARVPARARAGRRDRGRRRARGYALNLPLRRRTRRRAVEPLVRVDDPAYVEAVKLAEDRSGDVVVRLYEPFGARGRRAVTAGFGTTSVTEVDLLERPLGAGSAGTAGAHTPPVPDRHPPLPPVVPDRTAGPGSAWWRSWRQGLPG